MREYISLEAAPIEEPCVQVSKDENYIPAMKNEVIRYKELMERIRPIPPELNCYYKIKSENHDFGTYYELVIYYNDRNEKEIDFAYWIESNLPLKWTDGILIYREEEKESSHCECCGEDINKGELTCDYCRPSVEEIEPDYYL